MSKKLDHWNMMTKTWLSLSKQKEESNQKLWGKQTTKQESYRSKNEIT